MKIVYTDGEVLECSKIKFYNGDLMLWELYADDIYTIPIDDIDHIEEQKGVLNAIEKFM